MWNMLKSTHPVIFGIGTVECIVSGDKTELVRSCAVGHCSLWSDEPTQQFGSRRQAGGVSGPQAGLVLGAVTETAEGNAELPPAQEGRTSFRLCLHVWLARMSHVWRSLRVFGRLCVTSCLLFLSLYSSVASLISAPNSASLDSAIMQTNWKNTMSSCLQSKTSQDKVWQKEQIWAVAFASYEGVYVSYEGVLVSNRPAILELVPFSGFGEEHPGVGPL